MAPPAVSILEGESCLGNKQAGWGRRGWEEVAFREVCVQSPSLLYFTCLESSRLPLHGEIAMTWPRSSKTWPLGLALTITTGHWRNKTCPHAGPYFPPQHNGRLLPLVVGPFLSHLHFGVSWLIDGEHVLTGWCPLHPEDLEYDRCLVEVYCQRKLIWRFKQDLWEYILVRDWLGAVDM